jgi:hypothetical protein
VHPLRLEPRRWIGVCRAAVEAVAIACPNRYLRHETPMQTIGLPAQAVMLRPAAVIQLDLDQLRCRGPDGKTYGLRLNRRSEA